MNATYTTNSAERCQINFLSGEEGQQQENLIRWLTNELSPHGAYLSAQIREPSGQKEFTEVILTSADCSFLFMSKTLAIFAQKKLPSHTKLASDIIKDLRTDLKK